MAHIARTLLSGVRLGRRSGKTLSVLAVTPTGALMREVAELLETGRVRATIDERLELEELPEALRRVGANRVRGKLVVVP